VSAGGGGSELLSLLKMLGWVQTGFHVALAAAFVIYCFFRARQIGVGGASLLGIMGLLDVTSVVVYRLGMTAVTSSHASMGTLGATFNALSVMDIMFTLLSTALVATAYFLLRRAPVPAYRAW
jgi:hypothetical protein